MKCTFVVLPSQSLMLSCSHPSSIQSFLFNCMTSSRWTPYRRPYLRGDLPILIARALGECKEVL